MHGINFASWEDTASVTVPSIAQLARLVARTPHPFNNVGTGKINSIVRGVGPRAAATLHRGLRGSVRTPFAFWLSYVEELATGKINSIDRLGRRAQRDYLCEDYPFHLFASVRLYYSPDDSGG